MSDYKTWRLALAEKLQTADDGKPWLYVNEVEDLVTAADNEIKRLREALTRIALLRYPEVSASEIATKALIV